MGGTCSMSPDEPRQHARAASSSVRGGTGHSPVTAPVASRVSVATPSRMVARYSLSCPWRCRGQLGRLAQEDGQEPGRHGIQRASVADLGDAEHAAKMRDDLERGDPRPLVGEQETVRRPSGRMPPALAGRAHRRAASASRTAPRTARLRVGQAPRAGSGRPRSGGRRRRGRPRCGPRPPRPWRAGSPSRRPAARGRAPPPWPCARSEGSSRTPRPPAGPATPPARGRSPARPPSRRRRSRSPGGPGPGDAARPAGASRRPSWRRGRDRRRPRRGARRRGRSSGSCSSSGRTRVGDDRGVEVHRDVGGQREPGRLDQVVDHLAGGGGPGVHPVDVAVAAVVSVVVDVEDPRPRAAGALEEAAEPRGIRAVERDDQVELVPARLPLLDVGRARQEVERVRHRVRAGEGDRPAAARSARPSPSCDPSTSPSG